nr:NUDIX domain-containing protein [Marinobacter sp. X15-166B]
MWGGLWSLPELDPAYVPEELADACERALGFLCGEPEVSPGFRHTFSHYHLHIQPARLVTTGSTAVADRHQRWTHRDEALSLGLPAPVRTLLSAPEPAGLR